MRRKSENEIQSECCVWFNNTYPHLRGLLFAVPNGGGRSSLEGKILKMTGVRRGVADLLFMYQGETYCIEMKTETGTQSNYQIEWQFMVEKHGFSYVILRSLNEFKKHIQSIVK